MNRDDIIRMAREAGLTIDDSLGKPYAFLNEVTFYQFNEMLERFAALVAADVLARSAPPAILVEASDIDQDLLRDMLAKSKPGPMEIMPEPPNVAAEREACAKVCDAIHSHLSKDHHWEKALGPLMTASEAIRARGAQQPPAPPTSQHATPSNVLAAMTSAALTDRMARKYP